MPYNLPQILSLDSLDSTQFRNNAKSELEKLIAAGKSKLQQTAFFQSESLAKNRNELIEVLAGIFASLEFLESFDRQLRSEFDALFGKAERVQVIKHEVGDLWGSILTLRKSVESLENSLLKAPAGSAGVTRVLTEIAMLQRAASDTFRLVSGFIGSRLGSSNLSSLNSLAFSMINSSISSELDKKAIEYLTSYSPNS